MSETPSWLNKDFILYTLNTYYSLEHEILHLNITLGVEPGNNYCSEVYKVHVNYNTKHEHDIKEKHLYIKSPLEKSQLDVLIKEGKLIEKEIIMYYKCFPQMKTLFRDFDVAPKHYPCMKPGTLVLEDLSKQGFVMRNKYDQLDFDHSAAVIKTIATFHAYSVVLHKHNPALVEEAGTPSLLSEESSETHVLVHSNLLKFIGAVQTLKGYERFADLSQQLLPTHKNHLVDVYTKRRSFNVLNHGDLWTNNVMFKYRHGNIDEVKLIDFQGSVYGSCGIDLIYFIFSSIALSVKEQRLQELLSVYLDTLNSCLAKFNCEERLSAQQLEEELDYCLAYGFFTMYCPMAVMYSGMKSTSSNDEMINNAFIQKCYVENVKQLLLYLEKKQFFQIKS